MQQVEGQAGGQSPRQTTPGAAPVSQPASESAALTLRRLLSDRQAAELLGVGERTFAELVATAEWMPNPIRLGPRLRRWDPDELMQAARTGAPRSTKQAEPAQLARARINRMKAGG